MQASVCPMCRGLKEVSRWVYEEAPEMVTYDRDESDDIREAAEAAEVVSCRVCDGTGVVWPPAGHVGPLHVTGDVVVTGNVVSSGFRDLQQSVGTVDFVVPYTCADSDTSSLYTVGESFDAHVTYAEAVSVPPCDNLKDMTVIRLPPDGGEFLLDGCDIEVGEEGGAIHIDTGDDPTRFKASIRNCRITSVAGFKGTRIRGCTVGHHPERKRVLDFLATLPEDMPIGILTPKSRKELHGFRDFVERAKPGTLAARGAEALADRMEAYWKELGKPDVLEYPSARLAGLPVSEGDER